MLNIINPTLGEDGGWVDPSSGVSYDPNGFILGETTRVQRELAAFQRDVTPLRALFGDKFSEVEAKRRMVSTEIGIRRIAFLSYENPWAKSGGVLAVANSQVDALIEAGEKAFRISPLHKGLITSPFETKALDRKSLLSVFNVPFAGSEIETRAYKVVVPGRIEREWILFEANGFFEMDGGVNHTEPYYDTSETEEMANGPDSLLLKDSLFACQAVPYLLKAIGLRENIVIHANDWQFASTVLTVNSALIDDRTQYPPAPSPLKSAVCVLSMHNSIDHYLPPWKLKLITDLVDDSQWPPVEGDNRPTVLSRMSPLFPQKIAVVSPGFSDSLTQHPLQTKIFVPHMQGILKDRTFGNHNGQFGQKEPAFSEIAMRKAEQGDFSFITAEKTGMRKKALTILSAIVNSPNSKKIGTLMGGDTHTVEGDIASISDDVTLLFTSGREERTFQKGFDRVMQAFRRLERGKFRLVIVSWPGNADEVTEMFEDEACKLAQERFGEVVFLREKINEGYQDILSGMTSTIWASEREPFGGITEPLAAGTPAIARLTEGLATQLMEFLHTNVTNQRTPIIYGYHEHPNLNTPLDQQIVDLHHAQTPKDRFSHPLHMSQSAALAIAMAQLGIAYQLGRDTVYAQGLATLAEIPKKLPWRINVLDCQEHYAKSVE